MHIEASVSRVAKYVNGLNTSIKRQRFGGWILKAKCVALDKSKGKEGELLRSGYSISQGFSVGIPAMGRAIIYVEVILGPSLQNDAVLMVPG